ncbi:MAG: trypsin-like peptidase domain-containing protein [Candidatus Moranbacteria bacterium]|nr:trypsin-like peptidase domain-containing protein [Candidatus Moranbacteria bacterium]
MEFVKKTLRIGLIVIFVFLIGGVGGLFVRERIVPSLLASFPSLSRVPMFQNIAGNVTVIEKTEQLVVREDASVDAIVSQPSTAVVNIIASEAGKETAALFQPGKSRTGVLLTNDGLIVTYGNPFADFRPAKEVLIYRALLFDGTSHEAKLIGEDPLTDLSFFRIDGGNFPAIALADSDDSRPGTKLVAIGNSFEEYQNRFSIGVLSHRNKTFNLSGKTVASTEKWEGVLEMDLANAGEYVGGPAVNFRSEMVGLFGNQTIDGKETSFLLPSNTVRDALRLATEGALDKRPSLGAYYLTLTKASAFGSGAEARDRGALIYSPSGRTGLAVLSGSSAEEAGLRVGDVITMVGGREVNLDNPLSVALGRFRKGDMAELTVVRSGKEILVSVTLE